MVKRAVLTGKHLDTKDKKEMLNVGGDTINLNECEIMTCECGCEKFTTFYKIVKIPATHLSKLAGKSMHSEEYMCLGCAKATGINKGI